MKLFVSVATAAVIAVAATEVEAQQVTHDWALSSPGAEAALVAASTASLAVFLLPQRRSDWGPSPAREHDDGWAGASDVTGGVLGTALTLTMGFALEGATLERGDVAIPYETAVRTSLAELEAALITSSTVVALKRFTGRCRPRAWRVGSDGIGRCMGASTEDHAAFPSGHTAPVAAIAAVRLALLARAPDDAGLRWVGFGVAEGQATSAAFLRVLAGAHSWEDVAAGWVLGHALGAAIGLLHPTTTPPTRPGQGTSALATAPVFARWETAF